MDGFDSEDGKSNGDLKVTETNKSDGLAVGDVEALRDVRSDDELLGDEDLRAAINGRGNASADGLGQTRSGGMVYKVYKRRWFGLVQLVLLNIIVSWDVSTCICSASLIHIC